MQALFICPVSSSKITYRKMILSFDISFPNSSTAEDRGESSERKHITGHICFCIALCSSTITPTPVNQTTVHFFLESKGRKWPCKMGNLFFQKENRLPGAQTVVSWYHLPLKWAWNILNWKASEPWTAMSAKKTQRQTWGPHWSKLRQFKNQKNNDYNRPKYFKYIWIY